MAETLLRAARPEEAAALSALAWRAKAGWGYDAAFMAACRSALTVTPADLAQDVVWVAAREGALFGMVTLAQEGPDTHLESLFIDPPAQGQGLGQMLFDRAVVAARARGASQIKIASDPGAEGFYLRMGARRVGEVPSEAIAGRMLPALVFDLSQDGSNP